MEQKSQDQNTQQGGAAPAGQKTGAQPAQPAPAAGSRQSASPGQRGAAERRSADDLIGIDEEVEVQQSAQRVGMGSHRQGGRPNEQALDGASDVDSLGTHSASAGKSRS